MIKFKKEMYASTKNIHVGMWRALTISLLLTIAASANGQPLSAAETVKNYTVAQKRLLVISTLQFENFLTQDNLDQDSLMVMACQITGMPFLLPYDEGFAGDMSGGEDLINTGEIAAAIQLAERLDGKKKMQMLLELAIWYLHQPGTHKTDLDSANFYMQAASELSKNSNYSTYQREYMFLTAELAFQKGNISDSRNTLLQIVSNGQKDQNNDAAARAYQHLGILSIFGDSMKLAYQQQSLALYQKLDFKEKEIELLGNILEIHGRYSANLMVADLHQIMALMQSTNFKHVLFAQNILALSLGRQIKYLDALNCINAAIENMKWSGMDAVAGAIYYRAGSIYEVLGKNEDALSWFKKTLDIGTNDTHLFWYKSLFFAHSLLITMNRPAESLSIIQAVTAKSPPITLWEQMQVLSCKGECFEHLDQPKLADVNYTALLNLAKRNPLADPHGELTETYFNIGIFYAKQQDKQKARLFLEQGLKTRFTAVGYNVPKYHLLFAIDSLEGNYKAALQNHIKYEMYNDSLTSADQRQKMNDLAVKYVTDKKDQDIALLRQKGIIQQEELRRNKLIRNVMIGGSAALLLIASLLYSQFKSKQRTNRTINKKNALLQHLVDEKEWLLKEVHHRVKNNLHTVICLLESQARHLENDALKAIEVSQHRIYAMSLIHQKLYQSEDIKLIDMASYVPELIGYLDTSFGAAGKIRFQLDIDPVKLDVAQAIPVGLIINEAVTNSIKYAFPGARRGTVSIRMTQIAETIRLNILDNGIGMDLANTTSNSGSLGIKLIKGLIEDLNGEIDFEMSHGTKISITFPTVQLEEHSPTLFALNSDQ